MADAKISALTALTGANVDATADVLAIVDTSVTTTKKILVEELGIALNATQAGQEAGTSTKTLVSPAVQQYHPSASKAWCFFDGTTTGTNAPTVGYNVTSVTRNGTGDYTINLTTAFSSVNYAYAVTAGVSGLTLGIALRVSQTASAFRFTVNSAAPTAQDSTFVSVIFFGDQ